MKILLVEDDLAIGKTVKKAFAENLDECIWEKDGQTGFDKAKTHQFDVIILDLMLPKLSGLEVLKSLRLSGDKTPVILLTALGSVEEKVAGLKAGADDYVVKPFAFPELLARIDAVCRRAILKPSPTLEAGGLVLDLTTRRVLAGKTEIILSPTEFSILELLIRNSGQVLPKRMLCEHLWESDWEGTTNVIEVHINRLRNKLKKCSGLSPIETVRGRGYVLITN